jgi:hypothetical protein
MQVHKPDRDGVKRAGVGAFTLEQKPGERSEAWLRTGSFVIKMKDEGYDYNSKKTLPASFEIYYDSPQRVPVTTTYHTRSIHDLRISEGVTVPVTENKQAGEPSLSQMIKQEAERLKG